MAPLPQPNPIDPGLPGGMPIDHVRTSSEYCFLCGAHPTALLLITSYHLGFGAPAIMRPFANRSTTKEKTGRRQHYSVCTICTAAWAADERTHQMMVDEYFSGSSATDRALREMTTTLGCAMVPSSDALVEAWLDRLESEFARLHPERWAQLDSEQNAAMLDAAISVAEEQNIDVHLTSVGAELALEHGLTRRYSAAPIVPADERQAFDSPEARTFSCRWTR